MKSVAVLCLLWTISATLGNPLPQVTLNSDGTVADTPEVAAAKAQHLQQLAQAGGPSLGVATFTIAPPSYAAPPAPAAPPAAGPNTQLVYVKSTFGPNRYMVVPVPRLTSMQGKAPAPSWNPNGITGR